MKVALKANLHLPSRERGLLRFARARLESATISAQCSGAAPFGPTRHAAPSFMSAMALRCSFSPHESDESEVDDQTAAPTTKDPPKKPLSDDEADEVAPTKQTSKQSSGVPGGSGSSSGDVVAPSAIATAASDSDSEDVWSKARQYTPPAKPKGKAKANSPLTLDDLFGSAKKYDKAVAQVASNLLNAATKVATGPQKLAPQPVAPPAAAPAADAAAPLAAAPAASTKKGRGKISLIEQVSVASKKPVAPPAAKKPVAPPAAPLAPDGAAGTPEEPKKLRAAKGTAGTFAGRRPPKNPAKLELFMAKKAAWEQTKEENQKTGRAPLKHSENQQAFFKHMSKYLKSNGGGKDGFRNARAAWNAAKKRPAAASSEAEPAAKTTKTTKKKQAKTTKKKRVYTKLY